METKWKILNLESNKETGVVVKITYSCNIKSENFSDRKVGTLEIQGDKSSDNFIIIEDLTEEDVISWVLEKLTQTTVDEITTTIIERLTARENKLNENPLVNGLPWLEK